MSGALSAVICLSVLALTCPAQVIVLAARSTAAPSEIGLVMIHVAGGSRELHGGACLSCSGLRRCSAMSGVSIPVFCGVCWSAL